MTTTSNTDWLPCETKLQPRFEINWRDMIFREQIGNISFPGIHCKHNCNWSFSVQLLLNTQTPYKGTYERKPNTQTFYLKISKAQKLFASSKHIDNLTTFSFYWTSFAVNCGAFVTGVTNSFNQHIFHKSAHRPDCVPICVLLLRCIFVVESSAHREISLCITDYLALWMFACFTSANFPWDFIGFSSFCGTCSGAWSILTAEKYQETYHTLALPWQRLDYPV